VDAPTLEKPPWIAELIAFNVVIERYRIQEYIIKEIRSVGLNALSLSFMSLVSFNTLSKCIMNLSKGELSWEKRSKSLVASSKFLRNVELAISMLRRRASLRDRSASTLNLSNGLDLARKLCDVLTRATANGTPVNFEYSIDRLNNVIHSSILKEMPLDLYQMYNDIGTVDIGSNINTVKRSKLGAIAIESKGGISKRSSTWS